MALPFAGLDIGGMNFGAALQLLIGAGLLSPHRHDGLPAGLNHVAELAQLLFVVQLARHREQLRLSS